MTDTTDIPQLDNVDAAIDALADAPLLEVYRTLLPFDDQMVTAAAVMRALAGGGAGGSLPEEWTVGEDGSLEIAPADGDAVVTLRLRQAEGDGNRFYELIDGDDVVRADCYIDDDGIVNFALNGPANFQLDHTYLNADGSMYVQDSGFFPVWGARPGATDETPREFFLATPPPDDADIHTGERVQWYDATEGAVKFGIKQRDSAGNLFERISAALTADATAFVGVEKVSLTVGDAAEIMAALVTLGLVTDDT